MLSRYLSLFFLTVLLILSASSFCSSKCLSCLSDLLSPIEIWRPGYKVTPYNIPIIRESKSDKHDKHFEEQKELAGRINSTVKKNNDKYLESMDLRKSNQRRIDKLRHFKIGDKVTLRKLTGNNTIDKLADINTGPYTVTTVEDTGVDYILQLIGSSNQPVRAHVDRIHLFRTFEATEVDTAAPAPAAGKKEYAAERIMGEKKHSARAGGGTSFLVQWEDTDDTVHKCSWEPESNLTHRLHAAHETVASDRSVITERQTGWGKDNRHHGTESH